MPSDHSIDNKFVVNSQAQMNDFRQVYRQDPLLLMVANQVEQQYAHMIQDLRLLQDLRRLTARYVVRTDPEPVVKPPVLQTCKNPRAEIQKLGEKNANWDLDLSKQADFMREFQARVARREETEQPYPEVSVPSSVIESTTQVDETEPSVPFPQPEVALLQKVEIVHSLPLPKPDLAEEAKPVAIINEKKIVPVETGSPAYGESLLFGLSLLAHQIFKLMVLIGKHSIEGRSITRLSEISSKEY